MADGAGRVVCSGEKLRGAGLGGCVASLYRVHRGAGYLEEAEDEMEPLRGLLSSQSLKHFMQGNCKTSERK